MNLYSLRYVLGLLRREPCLYMMHSKVPKNNLLTITARCGKEEIRFSSAEFSHSIVSVWSDQLSLRNFLVMIRTGPCFTGPWDAQNEDRNWKTEFNPKTFRLVLSFVCTGSFGVFEGFEREHCRGSSSRSCTIFPDGESGRGLLQDHSPNACLQDIKKMTCVVATITSPISGPTISGITAWTLSKTTHYSDVVMDTKLACCTCQRKPRHLEAPAKRHLACVQKAAQDLAPCFLECI
jgi:hypothetical protein